mgnify:CR=1 FL=1
MKHDKKKQWLSIGLLTLGAAALAVAVVLAYRGKSLIVVALSSSAAVLIVEWVMTHL